MNEQFHETPNRTGAPRAPEADAADALAGRDQVTALSAIQPPAVSKAHRDS